MPSIADAHARGWGDPSAKGYREQHIVGVDTPAGRLYVRSEVAHLFLGFLQEIVAKGYRLNERRDDWGYNFRPVRGYETQWAKTHDFHYLSNHSWGLALDLDATDHPLNTHKGFPPWVVEAAHKWGLSWGGDYVNRPDPMHFEFLGKPADVGMYPITHDAPVPHPAPHPIEEDDVPAASDVVATLATPSGKGRWLLTYDGGVRTEGDAKFYGSVPGLPEKDRQGVGGFWVIEPFGDGYQCRDAKGNVYRFGAK